MWIVKSYPAVPIYLVFNNDLGQLDSTWDNRLDASLTANKLNTIYLKNELCLCKPVSVLREQGAYNENK